MKLRLSKISVLNWIMIRHHVWSKLMHCYKCRGPNDFFHKTGFLSGWAVSNTCRACLKEEANEVAECEECGWIGPGGNACFLKYPDSGPGGMDEERWTCRDCARKYVNRKAKIIKAMGLGGVE